MKLELKKRLEASKDRIMCIAFGTVIGTIVYIIFLYLNIAILGWNLGLLFAPLLAGYSETMLAEKLIGTDTGAISSLLLFTGTTIYSFILVNPTLGLNFITIGASVVILQAAFPNAVNYILFSIAVFVKETLTSLYLKFAVIAHDRILKKPIDIKRKEVGHYDEIQKNQEINNLDFMFMTSTDILDKYVINLGQYQSTVIIEKDLFDIIDFNSHEIEEHTLNILKYGKDECLIKLTEKIKAAGGNGVIDLDIQYNLIGIGGDSFQISAMGMGVYIK